MKKPDYLKDVQKFHKKFDLIRKGPLTQDLIGLRLNFLLEELNELASAYKFYCSKPGPFGLGPEFAASTVYLIADKPEALDALVDILYVLMGTVDLFGFGKVFDEAWRRVQKSNMQKIRAKRKTKRGTMFDVVKPATWKKPYLEDLV